MLGAGVAMRNKIEKKDLWPRSSVFAGKPRGARGGGGGGGAWSRQEQRFLGETEAGLRSPVGSFEDAGLQSSRKCLKLRKHKSMKCDSRDKER